MLFRSGTIDEEVISRLNIYSALDDCLAAEALDACIIAVHTDLHYELATLALNAGVHVFLEKPFSLSVDEGMKMIELAREKNLVLMIGHVVRFMPVYQTLKHWIDSGEYGALKFLSLIRFSGLPVWGQWKEKRKAFGSSGGALFDLLIHDIDFAQWVLGVPGRTTRRSCATLRYGRCLRPDPRLGSRTNFVSDHVAVFEHATLDRYLGFGDKIHRAQLQRAHGNFRTLFRQ